MLQLKPAAKLNDNPGTVHKINSLHSNSTIRLKLIVMIIALQLVNQYSVRLLDLLGSINNNFCMLCTYFNWFE